MNSSYYQANENDTEKFISDAIDHYASIHVVLPKYVVMHSWRRVTELPTDKWESISYGAIPVKIYSPDDNNLPDAVRGVQIRADVALCFGD
jgi:hypothetical protein